MFALLPTLFPILLVDMLNPVLFAVLVFAAGSVSCANAGAGQVTKKAAITLRIGSAKSLCITDRQSHGNRFYRLMRVSEVDGHPQHRAVVIVVNRKSAFGGEVVYVYVK